MIIMKNENDEICVHLIIPEDHSELNSLKLLQYCPIWHCFKDSSCFYSLTQSINIY